MSVTQIQNGVRAYDAQVEQMFQERAAETGQQTTASDDVPAWKRKVEALQPDDYVDGTTVKEIVEGVTQQQQQALQQRDQQQAQTRAEQQARADANQILNTWNIPAQDNDSIYVLRAVIDTARRDYPDQSDAGIYQYVEQQMSHIIGKHRPTSDDSASANARMDQARRDADADSAATVGGGGGGTSMDHEFDAPVFNDDIERDENAMPSADEINAAAKLYDRSGGIAG